MPSPAVSRALLLGTAGQDHRRRLWLLSQSLLPRIRCGPFHSTYLCEDARLAEGGTMGAKYYQNNSKIISICNFHKQKNVTREIKSLSEW